ncbi:MAG: type II toxin-antitoxin system RelE/ParE family toxin [Candidatus Acidiferrum sp.]
MPAREFVDSLDEKAAARIDAFIERLRNHGNRMEGKFVKKLTGELFELRVKQFDRIFPSFVLLSTGQADRDHLGFQKKTEQTPPSEIAKAERLKALWLRYRNRYPVSQKEKDALAKEWGT